MLNGFALQSESVFFLSLTWYYFHKINENQQCKELTYIDMKLQGISKSSNGLPSVVAKSRPISGFVSRKTTAYGIKCKYRF